MLATVTSRLISIITINNTVQYISFETSPFKVIKIRITKLNLTSN